MVRIKEKKRKHKKDFIKGLARIILKLIGWRTEGEAPAASKYVMLGYPHTSNWDVPIGLLIFLAMGVRLHWVGKQTLFKMPFGWFMKKLGGIPVDRSRSQNFVRQVVDKFNDFDELVITMSPEGTRSKSPYWRSGFYHIARGANVPVALAFLDYRQKRGGFLGAFVPTGNIRGDLEIIKKHYVNVYGKIVENMGEIKLPPATDAGNQG